MRPQWIALSAGLAFVAFGLLLLMDADDDGSPQAGAEEHVIDMEVSRYAYTPGSNGSLKVAPGSMVTLRITSVDVTHGLAISEYGINVEIPPGETVEVRLRADQEGEFKMYCTVFCGAGHPQHKGSLHVG